MFQILEDSLLRDRVVAVQLALGQDQVPQQAGAPLLLAAVGVDHRVDLAVVDQAALVQVDLGPVVSANQVEVDLALVDLVEVRVDLVEAQVEVVQEALAEAVRVPQLLVEVEIVLVEPLDQIPEALKAGVDFHTQTVQ